MTAEGWREGSVRFFCVSTQEYKTAEPGSMWFSTITIAAEEVFLDGEWKPIWPEDEDHDND